MSTVVIFKSYDLGHEMEVEIPDGLPDKKALKEFVDNMTYSYEYKDAKGEVITGESKFSHRDRKSAFRSARRVYKSYNPDWWEEAGEEYG